MPHRPDIDRLRAWAVLAVVIFHLDPGWLPGGFLGVDVFFVISGYLITRLIQRDFAAGTFTFRRFYQRRIARIVPAFLATACATLLAARWLYTEWDYASAGASFHATLLSFANHHLLRLGNYFEVSPDAQPFLHYWSLSVEEQFYLVYPVGLWLLLRKKSPQACFWWLAVPAGLSFAGSVVLSYREPASAFYLLPSRAWELLAGSLLALIPLSWVHGLRLPRFSGPALRAAGFGMLLGSFIFVKSDQAFPGWRALFPVLAAVLLLAFPAPPSAKPFASAMAALLGNIGRLSYSLYLWHWPIFSFVDYTLVLSTPGSRLGLKLALTTTATLASYFLIEQPARAALNRPRLRLPGTSFQVNHAAFLLLGLTLLLSPVGYFVRHRYYLDASDASDGALVFPRPSAQKSLILMGDSQASMYGVAVQKLAAQLNLRLIILSEAGGFPLAPAPGDVPSPLWQQNLTLIQQEKPAFLLLSNHWVYKLSSDPSRLAATLAQIQPHVGRILLFTQPPLPPRQATRAGLRAGSRPPFYEDPGDRTAREAMNQLVRQSASASLDVLDLDPLLIQPDGELILYNALGRPLYQDRYHLSNFGTALVGPLILKKLVP